MDCLWSKDGKCNGEILHLRRTTIEVNYVDDSVPETSIITMNEHFDIP